MLKTIFFGSSDFAVPSLRVTAERAHVVLVVTQPDRPAGRGHKLRPTPVKSVALELGIPVVEPPSLRDFAGQMQDESPDLFVLASYGKILPPALLDIPNLGALNVHPSLLPKFRGATPIQTALLEGESQTGVTIMLMDAGMDTGDVVLQERTPISSGETYGELHDRLALFGAQVLSHAIDLAKSGYIPRVEQSGTPSVTRPLRKEDLAVDWHAGAKHVANVVRAFSPVPAARAQIAQTPVKLRRVLAVDFAGAAFQPGEIAGIFGDAVRVRCGDGAVDVLELVPPNRGAISGADFARSLAAGQSR